MSATMLSLSCPHTTCPPSTWKLGTPHTPSLMALHGGGESKAYVDIQESLVTYNATPTTYLLVLLKSFDLASWLCPRSVEIFLAVGAVSNTLASTYIYTHIIYNMNTDVGP